MALAKKYNMEFYQVLGKLFYAIAVADGHVKEEEANTLKRILKAEWDMIDKFNNNDVSEDIKQIEIVFNWLSKKQEVGPNRWLKEFFDFKRNNEELFTENIKHIISKTAHSIANSYSRKNKSELILLAKLDLELKAQKNEKQF